jgi:predicted hydrolase (HD superfamily)
VEKMNIKYKVTLTEAEREELDAIIAKGQTQGYRIRHAQILLAVDDIPENREWTDKKIAKAYKTTEKSVGNLRRRFVEKGFTTALERQKRETPPKIKIDGETEAKIVALTCSDAPEGRSQWTLRLLAEKVVELGIMDSVSHTAIANCLKKTRLSHGYKSSGVSQSSQPSL